VQVIAVTGASSFIGTHLLEHLLPQEEVSLRLLINRNVNVPIARSGRISIQQGNMLKPETLRGFVETGCVVVNLAYLDGCPPEENILAIENLLKSCMEAGVRRLVHCSTAVVAGRTHVRKITETTGANPVTEYEVTKERIEKLILEKSKGLFEAVILRPTAVFGRGGQNLIKLAENLRSGNRIINYLKSCIHQYRRMNLVYIDNVVAALLFLIRTRLNVDGEVFIISDDEDSSNNYHDVEEYLMSRLNCRRYPFLPVPIPFPVLKTLLRIVGRTNINPELVYDCGKILSAGLKKPVRFEEGLSRFSDWYAQNDFTNRDYR
jgi:nucleoside-diphosphate-sugar epimerase